jgi:hypothetical protein
MADNDGEGVSLDSIPHGPTLAATLALIGHGLISREERL